MSYQSLHQSFYATTYSVKYLMTSFLNTASPHPAPSTRILPYLESIQPEACTFQEPSQACPFEEELQEERAYHTKTKIIFSLSHALMLHFSSRQHSAKKLAEDRPRSSPERSI